MQYPTKKQKKAVIDYIKKNGAFSIYAKDGIYQKLEDKLKNIHKIKHCILTNTGTSALSSAYFGLGLGRGDEVIVPVYTFIATVTPLLRLGCIPVFADVDSNTGNIILTDDLVSDKTKAVAITHMWGIPCNMEKIMSFCKKHNLKLIEDCSHAHFVKFNGQLLGTFGNVSAFSVGAKKIVSGGEGGFLLTNDDEIYLRATFLGHFVKRAKQSLKDVSIKIASKYNDLTSGFGENYRIHPYSAVMINELLEGEINDILSDRYYVYNYFAEKIKEIKNIEIHPIHYGAIYGFKPKLLSGDLNRFIENIKAEGLKIKRPDTIPLYNDKIFKECKFPLEYKGAREYIRNRLSVPDIITGNRKKDIKKVDQYIAAFKKHS